MLINCNNGIIVKSYEVIQTSDFVILLTYWVGNDSGNKHNETSNEDNDPRKILKLLLCLTFSH